MRGDTVREIHTPQQLFQSLLYWNDLMRNVLEKERCYLEGAVSILVVLE